VANTVNPVYRDHLIKESEKKNVALLTSDLYIQFELQSIIKKSEQELLSFIDKYVNI